MLTRDRIIDTLSARLVEHEFIRAAWLGGSDANGRADDLSDVDLCLLVRPGEVEPAAAAIESALESLSPVRIRYRLPMPTWHGFHQAFYQLEDAPEHTMVDWVMMEVGQPHPWFEVERHGTPRALFDKDGLIRPARVDRAAIDAAVSRRVDELRLKFPLFRHLPVKLVARGLPVDAAHFYFSLVLRPVVDLLRCVHCPERHDYGFRYVDDDLPAEASSLLRRWSRWATFEEMTGHCREAAAVFDRTLAEWDCRRGAPRSPGTVTGPAAR